MQIFNRIRFLKSLLILRWIRNSNENCYSYLFDGFFLLQVIRSKAFFAIEFDNWLSTSSLHGSSTKSQFHLKYVFLFVCFFLLFVRHAIKFNYSKLFGRIRVIVVFQHLWFLFFFLLLYFQTLLFGSLSPLCHYIHQNAYHRLLQTNLKKERKTLIFLIWHKKNIIFGFVHLHSWNKWQTTNEEEKEEKEAAAAKKNWSKTKFLIFSYK